MAHNTQILPFGTGDGANVRPPTDWAGDARRQTGFQVGVADPTAVNTAIRQAAFGSAMVALFTATYGTGDVLDNGDVTNFMAQFADALSAAAAAPPASMVLEGLDSGTANAVSISTLTPDNIVPSNGQLVVVTKNGVTNNGAMTAVIKGLSGPVLWGDSTALASGDWAANEPAILRWNGAEWRLLSFVGHPLTPQTVIQQITEGQALASGEGVVVGSDQKISLSLSTLTGDGLATADLFLFYKPSSSHHRTITYADFRDALSNYILALVPTAPPPASYTQYPGIGVGVGQQVFQQIQGVSGDNTPPGGSWGWTLGMIVSGAALTAGTITVSGHSTIYQNPINTNAVPANAGFGGAGGPWTAFGSGTLQGSWQLDGFFGPTNFALFWGYAFVAIWRRVA